ncbi:MAG: hypothetical protein ACLU99_07165 [Alphaproteobacteria bacterium]
MDLTDGKPFDNRLRQPEDFAAVFFIENMETGRGDLKIGNLMVLTRFYGKKVKIELQD